MARELNAEVLEVNGSMNGNIDTLRMDIQQFVSTISIQHDRKVVILDEADYLNPNSTQPALRNFMEQFHDTLFILTCNYPNKIIEPIHSRTKLVDFTFTIKERGDLAVDMFLRVSKILQENDVESIDKNALVMLVKKHFPDMRRMLNELQSYVIAHNKIDSGILASTDTSELQSLFALMKAKNYSAVRKWCGENADITTDSAFYSQFYRQIGDLITTESVTNLIVALAEYQYKQAFVVDKELNAAACLVTIMTEVEFK